MAFSATLTIAAAARPYPREVVNGDAWTVQQRGGVQRITLIDGLGHGPTAAEAADTAVAALEGAPELTAVEALSLCHAVLAKTRGAAVSIADIDLEKRNITFVGIGNVEGILRSGGRDQHLVPLRGIAGSAAPRVRAFDFALSEEWLLLMHSDGISSRVSLTDRDIPVDSESARLLADDLLTQWGRERDDATLVIACPFLGANPVS
jgi:hypothetical protein